MISHRFVKLFVISRAKAFALASGTTGEEVLEAGQE